jgi:membrane protein required for colicin V production
MTVTLLDAILIAIMLISAILAMVRGFSREILSIVAWIAAAAAAFFFYPTLTPLAREYINSDTAAMAASALGIFLVALIIVSFITLRVADFIIDSRIGPLDRTLGFLFGAARGLLLVVVAMVFFNWLTPENQPEWVANAYSKPTLDDLGNRLIAALPENPEETIRERFGAPEPAPATDGSPATIEDAIEGAGQPAAEEPPAN